MACGDRFRLLYKRCDECGRTNAFRRPHEKLLVKVLPFLACPYCRPECLIDSCSACRFPYSIVPHHSHGMCTSCNVAYWRYQRSLALQKPMAS